MSKRNQRKSTKSNEPIEIPKKRIENSWVLLIPDTLFESSNFNIITLPHPSHGSPSKFCIDTVHKKIFEVVIYSEPYRSWFVGESVKSDGNIQILTPINPLFIILPRLREHCSKKAVPLEDLLSEKGFSKIIECIDNLDCIADLKGSPDMKAYKFNEDKVMKWLEGRVRKLAKVLKLKNVHVTSGAVSATFVASSIDNNHIEEEFYLKYAHGMLSEYIEDDLAEQLEQRFKFKPDLIASLSNKRKSEVEISNDSKKVKSENTNDDNQENGPNGFTPIFNDIKKPKPLSAKEKARQKAASGTKTISAFFTKK